MKCKLCPDDDQNSFASLPELNAHRRADHPTEYAAALKRAAEKRPQNRPSGAGSRGGATPRPAPAPEPEPEQRPLELLEGGAGEQPPGLGGAEVLDAGEAAPQHEGQGWRERWRRRRDRPQIERVTNKRRVHTDELWGQIWGGLGWFLERTLDPGVGRAMAYQGPIAGELLERLTKDTFIDRMAQPIASRWEDMNALGQLLEMPMLVGMIERNPDMRPMLEPMLRAAVRRHLVAMVPIIKKREAEEREAARAAAALGFEIKDDAIGEVMALLLGNVNYQQAPPEDADRVAV